jgi:hypothetical protein
MHGCEGEITISEKRFSANFKIFTCTQQKLKSQRPVHIDTGYIEYSRFDSFSCQKKTQSCLSKLNSSHNGCEIIIIIAITLWLLSTAVNAKKHYYAKYVNLVGVFYCALIVHVEFRITTKNPPSAGEINQCSSEYENFTHMISMSKPRVNKIVSLCVQAEN